MSCCAGNSGCGPNCKCGGGCDGCNMYPELSYTEATDAASQTLVLGVAPQKTYFEGSETVMAAGENGCKCGPNCTCNPCNCK